MRIIGLILCLVLCVFMVVPAAYARREEPTTVTFPGSESMQPPVSKLQFKGGSACVCSGKWQTNWGEMKLSQYGDGTVKGQYTYDNGKIEGTISGQSFSGTWSESPTYQGPRDRGPVELEFSEDCLSFKGRWKYDSTNSWYENGWTGTKTQGAEKLFGPD